jgi:hypothetical protein
MAKAPVKAKKEVKKVVKAVGKASTKLKETVKEIATKKPVATAVKKAKMQQEAYKAKGKK